MKPIRSIIPACALLLFVLFGACMPAEKQMTFKEEIELQQLKKEGQMRSPQEQKAYECAEWRRRHPPSKDPVTAVLESGEPPECQSPPDAGKYDPLEQRQKDVDAIIDKQLKESVK